MRTTGLIFPAWDRGFPSQMIPARVLDKFECAPISGEEDALFRNRYDTKYILAAGMLPEVLERLSGDYLVLRYDGRPVQEYASLYFDDRRLSLYRDHQRGKRERFKVRMRFYPASGFACLELKMKTNKDTTRKWRRPVARVQFEEGFLSGPDKVFLDAILNGRRADLSPVLYARFTRLTLQHKGSGERITFDEGLTYADFETKEERAFGGFVIAEIKQARPTLGSFFQRLMREFRMSPLRFSKYCYGVYLLRPGARHNRLKPRYLDLERKKAQLTSFQAAST